MLERIPDGILSEWAVSGLGDRGFLPELSCIAIGEGVRPSSGFNPSVRGILGMRGLGLNPLRKALGFEPVQEPKQFKYKHRRALYVRPRTAESDISPGPREGSSLSDLGAARKTLYSEDFDTYEDDDDDDVQSVASQFSVSSANMGVGGVLRWGGGFIGYHAVNPGQTVYYEDEDGERHVVGPDGQGANFADFYKWLKWRLDRILVWARPWFPRVTNACEMIVKFVWRGTFNEASNLDRQIQHAMRRNLHLRQLAKWGHQGAACLRGGKPAARKYSREILKLKAELTKAQAQLARLRLERAERSKAKAKPVDLRGERYHVEVQLKKMEKENEEVRGDIEDMAVELQWMQQRIELLRWRTGARPLSLKSEYFVRLERGSGL
jgi:hypothetical protein